MDITGKVKRISKRRNVIDAKYLYISLILKTTTA